MATYLITYHGAMEMPSSPEARDQMMAAFMQWAASVGDGMVDPGSPLGPSKVVTTESVAEGNAGGQIGGYTIIKADSMDAAVAAIRTHPFLSRGGTLQVSEAVAP
jgi:hypothetical protein